MLFGRRAGKRGRDGSGRLGRREGDSSTNESRGASKSCMAEETIKRDEGGAAISIRELRTSIVIKQVKTNCLFATAGTGEEGGNRFGA